VDLELDCVFDFLLDYIVHIASPQTCPADLSTKCADSGEWEGKFFPGIPTIKYEVKRLLTHLFFHLFN